MKIDHVFSNGMKLKNKKAKILSPRFFQRPTKIVAKDLLGKFLVRRLGGGKILAEMVTEVEVYDGPNDRASHASRGRTMRTAPMFEEGGIFYIYLCYGMYQMLNVVTGGKNYPAAILIRATTETKGPGRLTKKFKIDKNFNRKLASPKTFLWFEDRGIMVKNSQIGYSPRTGVDYAGPIWANKKWKLLLIEK